MVYFVLNLLSASPCSSTYSSDKVPRPTVDSHRTSPVRRYQNLTGSLNDQELSH